VRETAREGTMAAASNGGAIVYELVIARRADRGLDSDGLSVSGLERPASGIAEPTVAAAARAPKGRVGSPVDVGGARS